MTVYASLKHEWTNDPNDPNMVDIITPIKGINEFSDQYSSIFTSCDYARKQCNQKIKKKSLVPEEKSCTRRENISSNDEDQTAETEETRGRDRTCS